MGWEGMGWEGMRWEGMGWEGDKRSCDNILHQETHLFVHPDTHSSPSQTKYPYRCKCCIIITHPAYQQCTELSLPSVNYYIIKIIVHSTTTSTAVVHPPKNILSFPNPTILLPTPTPPQESLTVSLMNLGA